MATSAEVTATRSRLRKVAALASCIEELDRADRRIGAHFLVGRPTQEKLGVGYRALSEVTAPPASDPALTIAEVDAALGAVAAESGPGSVGRRRVLLEELFARATSDEQVFLRSLILREVRQGALDGLLVEAIASATGIDADEVRRATMVSGDVAAVTVGALEGGVEALAAMRLVVGRPIQPMLATTAEDVATGLGRLGGTARVETKLDGVRVQVHRQGVSIRVFTRNLREVTDQVPEIVAAASGLAAESFVLDGEAILADASGRPRPFQETMGRFGRSVSPPAEELSCFFFDVLSHEGVELLSLPLLTRIDRLREFVPVELQPAGAVFDDVEEAQAFLDRVLTEGHEGVMVKDIRSPYDAGRRGSSWSKVKPAHTLDLVVLAAEWGSGRRRGFLSNLHLGARDPDGGFVMLGKTFKGLTDEMLAWQTERYRELEVERRGRTVVVRPEQVVEVAFDGVQASTRYPGGLALRFARVKTFRADKTAEEADTIGTVRAIFESRR